MLQKYINHLNNRWNNAKEKNENSFKLGQYIIRQQYNYFNIYNSKNILIADQITTIEDLANCMVMIKHR